LELEKKVFDNEKAPTINDNIYNKNLNILASLIKQDEAHYDGDLESVHAYVL
jgi:hypothetical protein